MLMNITCMIFVHEQIAASPDGHNVDDVAAAALVEDDAEVGTSVYFEGTDKKEQKRQMDQGGRAAKRLKLYGGGGGGQRSEEHT